MDTLVSLRVFALVAEQRSFTAAAKRLGLSPAMVSKHVMRLEERLGTRLLNRTSRRVSLTEAGNLYLAQVRQTLDSLDEVEAAVSKAVIVPRGTLKISAPTWVASENFAQLLAGYHRLYPDVRLDIDLSGRAVNLVDEGYDLALRATTAARLDPGLIARPIAPVPFKLVGSPDYLERAGRPVRPSDLADHSLLLYAQAPSTGTLTLGEGDARASFRVSPVIHSENETLLHFAALAGMGLALLPSWLIAKDIETGRLEEVLSGQIRTDVVLHTVYPSRKYLSAKVRTFVEFVAKAFVAAPRD